MSPPTTLALSLKLLLRTRLDSYLPFSFSFVHLLEPYFQNFVKEVEDVMKVEFVSDKLKSVLKGIDKKKEKQSKRKKSLKYKGREKELGEQRIAINIAQREVYTTHPNLSPLAYV